MLRNCLGAVATVLALLLVLALLFYQSQRQDAPRKNDRILRTALSPDGRLRAYLVEREADSLSADVFKLFVAGAGERWHEGQMAMEGRRFSLVGAPMWLKQDWLCMVASADGIEDQEKSVTVAGSRVRIDIRSTAAACIDARQREGG
jgi:hypothetical protein